MKEKKIVIPTLLPEAFLDGKGYIDSGQNNTELFVNEKIVEESSEIKRTDQDKSIYDLLEEEIMSSDVSDAEKAKTISRLFRIRERKVNIMLAGVTGSGKSSTINALFNMEVAKVGIGVDPETECITKYELDNLTIWDTLGLGDSVENDEKITRDIIKKLNEMDEECNPLMDVVVVILDASSKDLGISYNLINKILFPCLGEEAAKERVLIAINQSDIAMKGNHWDAEKMNQMRF